MSGPVSIVDGANPLQGLEVDEFGRIAISNLPPSPVLVQDVYIDNSFLPVTVRDGANSSQKLGVDAQGRVTVLGPLTDAQLRAVPVPVSGTVTANVGTGTQPVSGTVTANAGTGTMAVAGPLTDAQLRATPPTVVANVGTGTQPVSLAAAPVTPVTDNGGTLSVDDGAGSLTVDGTVAVSSLPALAAGSANIGDVDVLTLPPLVAGTANIGDVDVLTLPALTPQAGAGSAPHAVASLGNSLGKTNVLRTGNLVTTATTADQVILTYTVTAGKTLYLQYFTIMARLTTFAATATFFGASSLETPSGTKVYTMDIAGTGISAPLVLTFDEPVPIAQGTVIRVVCTPSAVTSMTWKANLGGYEK